MDLRVQGGLAVTTWFVYLDLDFTAARANTPFEGVVSVSAMYVLRACAVFLVLFWRWEASGSTQGSFGDYPEWATGEYVVEGLPSADAIVVQLWSIWWLVPPALTTSTLSLLWGGCVYLSATVSLVLSVLLAAVLVGIAASPLVVFTPVNLTFFFAILGASLALPGALAQYYRARQPVESKKHAKKWKFLGTTAIELATIVLTLLSC